MAIDYEKINDYLKNVNSIEEELGKYQELFDPDKFIEFKQVTSSLKKNVEIAKSNSRKLSIGIIGAVKAGKSSFLNACIFGGKDYLPKAATPMTAALTRITYSDKPKAVIHFYTREDWETIEENASLYDEALKKEYEEYCETIDKPNIKHMGLLQGRSSSEDTKKMSRDEYEKKFKCQSENQRAAKELTRMVKDLTLMDKLDGVDEVEGDIISKLNDYVGADGYYTPIVSYVELQVDNPSVKDLEIVDTPGLNDPIVSRGIVTKQFLRSCDVVLLLSPCSQFMDAGTVNLMASSLPDAGVKEILVVGSKFDSGILNESGKSFNKAYRKSKNSYETQFTKNLEEVKKTGKHLDILHKMSPEKVLYVSSTCFTIDQKNKQGNTLNDNEKIVYNNLHQFTDFEDKYLSFLGGINKVQKAMNEILSRKKEIIENKNCDLLKNSRNEHLRILEKILQETVSSRTKLETISSEDLKKRITSIKDVIDSTRSTLMQVFDSAVTQCESKIERIRPQITLETDHHQKIYVDVNITNEDKTMKEGLFGWHRVTKSYEITNNEASISCVIDNIKQYSAKCHEFINNDFNNIFNKEEFTQKIKDVVLNAFSLSQKEFSEEEILCPLNNVLDKISIPHIKFDYTPYIDEVTTRFKDGYARNEEIHQLKSLQTRLLDKIESEILEQMNDAFEDITSILQSQAAEFADYIENDFCTELEKLEKQSKEREHYIKEYHKFRKIVKDMKAQIS